MNILFSTEKISFLKTHKTNFAIIFADNFISVLYGNTIVTACRRNLLLVRVDDVLHHGKSVEISQHPGFANEKSNRLM